MWCHFLPQQFNSTEVTGWNLPIGPLHKTHCTFLPCMVDRSIVWCNWQNDRYFPKNCVRQLFSSRIRCLHLAIHSKNKSEMKLKSESKSMLIYVTNNYSRKILTSLEARSISLLMSFFKYPSISSSSFIFCFKPEENNCKNCFIVH